MTDVSQLKNQAMDTNTTATTAVIKEEAIVWLEKRKLELETALRLGVTTCKDSIKIPYFQDGKEVGAKYRSMNGKNFRQDKGSKQCFYNFDVLSDETLGNEPLIITEGEFDTIAVIQSGFIKAVSVPNGAPMESIIDGQTKYAYVEEARKYLTGDIIIATDNDNQGVALMNDLALRIGRTRCKWVTYPSECKDLNDVLIKYGEKGVQSVINSAKYFKIDGLYSLYELPPAPKKEIFKSGLLDENYKVRLGDFSVVTGIPSHGKSAYVNDLICRLADKFKWQIAIASFEAMPQTDLRRCFRTWKKGKMEKYLTDVEKREADDWINNHFVFLQPEFDDNPTLAWFLERASAAVIQRNAKVVVIDPWNEIDHTKPAGMSNTDYTGEAIKQLKRFALKYNIHLIVVAHPAKMYRNKDGTTPIPTLYDIADSAHWYNKADVGVVVHRGEKDVIKIVKSKHHTEIGKPDERVISFNVNTNRFTAVDQNEYRGN